MGSGPEQAGPGSSAVTLEPEAPLRIVTAGRGREFTGAIHVTSPGANNDQEALERRAEELTALAGLRHTPGERAWYLQMASAFRKLAALGEREKGGGAPP